MEIKISVVVPIYNEVENILNLTAKIKKAVEKGFGSYEIVYVNDGSSDGSKEVLDKLILNEMNVRVFHFTKNNGQTAAIQAGLKNAKGELIVTMDGDLQTDPEDIYKLLSYIPEYDFVNGKRATREDGIKKKISSLIGNGVRNFITNDNITDTGCPLKLMKREVAQSFYLYKGMHRFLPTLAKVNGYKVIEVPVRHYDRMYGKSKYGVLDRLFVGLADAFAVRWMKKRYISYKIEGEEKYE